MGLTREIYVSAVAEEMSGIRHSVALTLKKMGYRAVWHEYSEPDSADCRAVVARKIRRCKGVIQLVGASYGPEPRLSLQVGGRTSYAQYEALKAREIGQPVWHFALDEDFPRAARRGESDELCQLQANYRRRVETFATYCRAVSTEAQLFLELDSLRTDLFRLRQRFYFQRIKSLLSRLAFHRLGLNGHPPDETSRQHH